MVCFSESQVRAIKSVPLCSGLVDDQWIWTGNSKGIYTTKSGYYVATKLLYNSDCNVVDGSDFNCWDKVWGSSMPPRTRFFLWRMIKNILPSKLNLIRRGVEVEVVCETCLLEEESHLHIFRDCIWAKAVWENLRLDEVIVFDAASFYVWLGKCFSGLTAEKISLFMAACSWIWENRNRVVFDKACGSSQVVACKISKWVTSLIGESGLVKSSPSISSFGNSWKAPQFGVIKINCDASFQGPGLNSHYGVVARNHEGNVIVAEAGSSGLVESVLHAETLAFHRALRVAKNLLSSEVIIEGDCLEVIHAVTDKGRSFAKCGLLLDELKESSCLLGSSVSFAHVKRKANSVAHLLAHLYCSFTEFSCNNVPDNICAAVISDKSQI